jgi:hypothetical protein
MKESMTETSRMVTNYRFVFLFFAFLVCVVLSFVVNVLYGIDIVYTHLFYIPIILTGIWYPRYAFFFAAALGLTHIVSDYITVETFKIGSLLRAVMLMVVAYVTRYLVLRRDRLFSELQTLNNELVIAGRDLHAKNEVLQNALNEIKTLKGILPICASCKKIRDDDGYWNQIESYLHTHTEAEFSHSLCPDCVKRLYPDI